ncbi:MAG: discoidin domain-containing protein [Gammaproteobacteria bacterium]|nr:discoidin domain-containing protein [Gammaproteobacteria bacterium]
MTARKLTVLLVCALAVAAVFALPAVAQAAYTTNTECLACHDQATGAGAVSKVDFTAPPTAPGASNVDYAKCKSCHWIGQGTAITGGYSHDHTGECYACHAAAVPYAAPFNPGRLMSVSTAFGYFNNANSLSAASGQVHAVHVNGSWQKNPIKYGTQNWGSNYCETCHGSTGCDSCHTLPITHADHTLDSLGSYGRYPPLSRKVALGTPTTTYARYVYNVTLKSETCTNPSCHAVAAAGTATFTPACGSCHPLKTLAHGYDSIPHVADFGIQSEDGMACTACHSTDLMTEHAKSTSAEPRSCATCHPNPRDQMVPLKWLQGCDQCHNSALAPTKHTGKLVVHGLASAPDCVPCHAGTLEIVHSSATTTTADGTFTSCLVCHNPAASPAGKDCIDCHFTFDQHYDVATHNATSTVSVNACGVCHDKDDAAGMDLKTVHARLGNGCDVCHRNPTRVGDIKEHTAECASCHTQQDVDYHREFTVKHKPTSDSSGCLTPCHPKHTPAAVIGDARIHPMGCATCHNGTLILVGRTARCVDCHGDGPGQVPTHVSYPQRHVASSAASAECTPCHEADIADTHSASSYGCNLCHKTVKEGGRADCAFCHTPHNAMARTSLKVAVIAECGNTACHGASGSVVVTTTADHYASHESSHVASAEDPSCALCHSMDMKTAHASAPSACVNCHQTKVATFKTAWDKTCVACHDTKHENMTLGHTLTSTPTCVECHDVADITVVHSKATTITAGGLTLTSCQVCHVPGGPAPTDADCATCHTTERVDYHTRMDAKHLSSTSDGCMSDPGCHASSRMLPDVHAPFVGGVKEYSTTCKMCHANTSATRIDWTKPVDTSCTGTCHDGYVHSDMGHRASAPDSQECVSCHGSNWVVQLHGAEGNTSGAFAKCATCHNQPSKDGLPAKGDITYQFTTSECANCHADHAPVATAHYTNASHESTQGADPACASCHVGGLNAEHLRATGGTFTCLACHTSARFKAAPKPWDKSCDTCHGAKHSNETTAHTSTQTSCSGLNCHAIGDVAPLHSKATTTVAGVPLSGCAVCHQSPTNQPITADCTTCHTAHGSLMVAHTALVSGACVECHETADVRTLHAKSPKGECAVCHDNAALATLPTNVECVSCHAKYTQIDPDHYVETSHTASAVAGDCYKCHKLSMDAEHSKTSVSPKVTCVSCHQGKVDGLVGGWNKTCLACHTAASTHSAQTSAHEASTSSACAGAGCHAVTDVAAIHENAVEGALTGCYVCHRSSDAVPLGVECATCHSATPHLHELALHTAPAGASCEQCHSTVVTTVHKNITPDACKVCHDNAWRIGDFRTKTAACVSCHGSIDTTVTAHDYYTTAHISTTTACSGTGCHVIGNLTTLHSKATTTVAGITYTACAVCHQSPAKQPTSTVCTTCHVGHGDITAKHTATAVSSACKACHETYDVVAIHKTKSCASCHGNVLVPILPANVECASCHADHLPLDTKHYVTADHTATDTGCSTCHYLDLKPEHLKASVSPVVTCVSCHETKVDAFTVAWTKKCIACHATKHTGLPAKHASTNTSCSGTACHSIADVSVIHAASVSGCAVCHTSPATVPTGKTDCASAGCHAGVGTSHHALHDASAAIDVGCAGCHFTYLDTEHAALGYSCATCHSSTNTAVKAAIANSVRACSACHPAVNGKNRHAAQNTLEFNKGNSGGHRAYSALPFMKSSFLVGTTAYTWPTPAASTFLKTGWTTTSMVTCNQCHSVSTTAVGPHGSTVKVNIDPAYPTDWATVYLTGSGTSSTTFICAKCHTNFGGMNDVHKESEHHSSGDGKCVGCHSQIPHAWRLPRLLAYKDDPTPYNSLYLTGLKLKNYTPTSWSLSDCSQSGCSEHSSSMSSRWPSVVQTAGVLKGRVLDTAGAPLTAAAVTTDKGQSGTTDINGYYDFGSVGTATYGVTAAKTGYVSQTKSVAVLADQTTTVDFALAPVPVNLALGKVFTASRTYSTTYAASKAGDDNLTTYWRSGSLSSSTQVEWLTVDLAAPTSVSKAEVVWASNRHATEFRVYTSGNNSTWTQIYSTTTGTGGTSTVAFPATSARYVKVECRRASSTNNGYGIAELRVFK